MLSSVRQDSIFSQSLLTVLRSYCTCAFQPGMQSFLLPLGIVSLAAPAKRLCDASSVLVGVELPISSRFQPSPLASSCLQHREKDSIVH